MDQDRPQSLLGAIIREQRELDALPMRQLAKCRISNPYLSQIERGMRAPSEAVVEALAASLDLSVDELYRRTGYVEPETHLRIHHNRISRTLSPGRPNSRRPNGARWRGSTEVSSTRTGYAGRLGTTAPTGSTAGLSVGFDENRTRSTYLVMGRAGTAAGVTGSET